MTVRELVWTAPSTHDRVRRARFERRVPFDLTLIAQVASALEACLAELFCVSGSPAVFPPVHVDADQWAWLCEASFVWDLCADRADLSVVITPEAARSIVAHAFGELVADVPLPLSAMELRVLERFVVELTNRLRPVRTSCGDPAVRTRTPASRRAYCELRMAAPINALIGIAADEKLPAGGPTLAPEDLADCLIDCSVQLRAVAVDIFTIAGLTPGDVVPLETKVGPYATLNVGPDPIAAGEGGVLGDRSAFKVYELI